MTWPTVAVNTTNVDQTTDSPATARADILDAIQKLNAMMATVNGGQLPLGGGPLSAWKSTVQALELTNGAIFSDSTGGGVYIAQNAYQDASAVWRYKATGTASVFCVSTPGFDFYTAASGVAGAAITWGRVFYILSRPTYVGRPGRSAGTYYTNSSGHPMFHVISFSVSVGSQVNGSLQSGVSWAFNYVNNTASTVTFNVCLPVMDGDSIILGGSAIAINSWYEFA